MPMYNFECPKCTNKVGLPPRKGDLPPFTPTCNNDEAHHHRRGELMKLIGIDKKRKR
jgi:hypothetical protein